MRAIVPYIVLPIAFSAFGYRCVHQAPQPKAASIDRFEFVQHQAAHYGPKDGSPSAPYRRLLPMQGQAPETIHIYAIHACRLRLQSSDRHAAMAR